MIAVSISFLSYEPMNSLLALNCLPKSIREPNNSIIFLESKTACAFNNLRNMVEDKC